MRDPWRSRAFVAMALGGLVAVATSGVSAQAASRGYAEWVEALRSIEVDPDRGAPVSGLTLQRDVASFRLIEGQLHLLRPIDGRVVGAVFTGNGELEATSPDPVEQAQLMRAYDAPAITVPFRHALFLFTDITAIELAQSVSWGAVPPPRGLEREIREALDYFTDDQGWGSRTVMLPLVNAGPGYFYAHVAADREDPTIFQVNPYDAEEVSISRRAKGPKRPEVVAQFHLRSDYETGRSVPQEALDLLRVDAYRIDTDIADNLDVSGRAVLHLRRVNTGHPWIPFRLDPDLTVDSVTAGDGARVPFARPRGSSDLWVDLASVGREPTDVTFHYHGDILERPRDLWVEIGTSSWYPVYEFGREIPYRLTFTVPRAYDVTTVGTLVDATTVGDRTTTVWETPPVRQMTFNMGEFDEYTEVAPSGRELSVLVNERAHRVLGARLAEAGYLLFSQGDMASTVARDLSASFSFYDDVYGPAPLDRFVATEIPYTHGEAYPGLVLLAWNTFQYTTEGGFDELFRAHEVAHQWWGIGVRPATYRDWWIAEGFSEFSGLWYAARARGSVQMYYQRLRETREALLQRRDESAPIALGTRAGSSENPGDYELTIYQKSAWVLHMLRTLLTDADTGNDDLFTTAMNRFYAERQGGAATTGQFQATVEDVVDADLDWFFRQWIDGSAIPTYRFSRKSEATPDGQVKMTVRVRQERVPEGFRMIVPILLDFGDDGSATVRVNVEGPVTEVELPILPREPDEVTFNPFEAVLAETVTEAWREG